MPRHLKLCRSSTSPSGWACIAEFALLMGSRTASKGFFSISGMVSVFKKWFVRKAAAPTYSVPPGERVYAVGDIHGRLDLFERLISQIESDDAAREGAKTTIILLGDLVDRGPESSGVVDAAIKLSGRRQVRTLCGNHEEMFLKSLESDALMREFLRRGGRETVLSYLRDTEEYNQLSFEEVRQRLLAVLPIDHLDFLRSLEDKVVMGDYLFVHAGVRPGIGLEDQTAADMRWIREPFLSSDLPSKYCVVHGHTITSEPTEKMGRIGIDTGAYQSGRLTALGLEGDGRWFLTSSQSDTGGF